jgi:hypothetical protein
MHACFASQPGKKHTPEALISATPKEAALNRTKLTKPGIEVEITDIDTKLTTTYESIRKAAFAIYSDIKSLSRLSNLLLLPQQVEEAEEITRRSCARPPKAG